MRVGLRRVHVGRDEMNLRVWLARYYDRVAKYVRKTKSAHAWYEVFRTCLALQVGCMLQVETATV